MSYNLSVGTTALYVSGEFEYKLVAGDTLYYGDSPNVSASNKIGTLAVGDTIGRSNPSYIVSAGTSYVSQRARSTPSSASVINPVDGASPTYDLASRQFRMKYGAGTFNVKDYGALGDGATDDAGAIRAAIAAAVGSDTLRGGGSVYFPPGVYKINSKILVDNETVRFVGATSGNCRPYGDWNGTTIKAAAGITAFEFRNGSNGAGARSRLEHLHIIGSDTSAGSNYGVVLSANSSAVSNCVIESFGGGGIHVRSGTVADPFIVDSSYNANCWQVEWTRLYDNYGHGLFVEGVDSNAGNAVGVDCSYNAGWGIYDNSAFGNVYTGSHLDGNTSGAIRIGAQSDFNRFVGTYKEGDATKALQIDAGGFGRNLIDFRYLAGNPGETIVDNSGTGDNVIVTSGGFLKQNRLLLGHPTSADVTVQVDYTGMTFGSGAEISLSRTGTNLLNTNAKLTATGGLGVGNSASATAVGTLSKKMQVFDAAGNSIGYVPIYTTIT